MGMKWKLQIKLMNMTTRLKGCVGDICKSDLKSNKKISIVLAVNMVNANVKGKNIHENSVMILKALLDSEAVVLDNFRT